jgi:hypothetical protein
MSARVLLIGWFLIPTGTLILASMITSLQLLERRYFDVVAPAGAIIAGYLIRALGPAPIRRLIVMTLVILSVLSVADATKFGDLRGALALVSSQATDSSTTLLTVGFRESLHPSFSQDPERSSFLTAATLYYPVPGHVVAMPITSPALEYPTARAEVEEAIASSDQILVVTLAGSAYEPWLEEVFGRHGYTSHVVGVVEPYTVTEFTPP